MCEAGVESETHAMGGRHEKGAIFPRLFYRAFHRRACLALHARSCSTAWKKRPFSRLLYFQNLWTKSYDVSTSSESSLIELLHITIYVCFRISEQTRIWFFREFFIWSLLLSSDRGLQDLRDLGFSLPLININPLTMLSTKYWFGFIDKL